MSRVGDRRRSRGLTLIESLISLLLFAIGVLALIGMYATAIGGTADAQYRAEASNAAHQLINSISGSVARNAESEPDSADLARFAYADTGAVCAYQVANVRPDPIVATWLEKLQTAGSGLPGATTAGYQQVRIEAQPGQFNRVLVTLCWNQPGETTPRRHEIIGYVN